MLKFPRLSRSLCLAAALTVAAGLPVAQAGAVWPTPRARGPRGYSAADAERIAQAEAKRSRKAAARVR